MARLSMRSQPINCLFMFFSRVSESSRSPFEAITIFLSSVNDKLNETSLLKVPHQMEAERRVESARSRFQPKSTE